MAAGITLAAEADEEPVFCSTKFEHPVTVSNQLCTKPTDLIAKWGLGNGWGGLSSLHCLKKIIIKKTVLQNKPFLNIPSNAVNSSTETKISLGTHPNSKCQW